MGSAEEPDKSAEASPSSPPATPAPAAAETPAAASAARAVLVVEDSMPTRRMMVKIFKQQGVSAVEATDGQAALDMLNGKGPDAFSLILCDLLMPVMDGPHFIVEARKLHADKLPPILICSSRTDRETLDLVMKLGVAGYILKPFKTEMFIAKVRQFIAPSPAPQ